MKTEKIKIPNDRGENIAAVVHYPSKETGQLAILCPGFLDSKDHEHLVRLAEALSERGYTVARFDPIGTWESEGSISEYLTSQYLDDVKTVLDYMLGKGKYGHILLGGHSRGGMISILYAARDPRISSVLAIMPSSPNTMKGKRYEDWKAKGFAISSNNVPGTTEKREFNVPFAHVIDREKFNVFEEVKNVHAPILVVAGELDAIVLPKDVKHIFDQANEPKKYLLIKGVGHAYRNNPAEIKIVNDEILKMLN